MTLYIKQRVFSFRDRFFVKDSYGADRFYVEGEIFSWGRKLHVYTTNGAEVAFIRQKLLSWMPRYQIEIHGRIVCEFVREFAFFKPRYRIEGLSWRLEGDFLAHQYSLSDGWRQIMSLSKKWFTWGDSYELNIADARDELVCLCIALSVDCDLAQQASNSHSSHHH